MMDLTSVVSGGQWLLPTIIVLLIGAGLYQYADRKNLTNLKKVLDYLLLFGIVIITIVLIIAHSEYHFNSDFQTCFLILILIFLALNTLLVLFDKSLKKKFGSKLKYLKLAINVVYAIVFSILYIFEYHLSLLGIVLVIVIATLAVLFGWHSIKNES
ncbi:hypothetical protein [Lactobacillus crispatus]|jgi:hypothetical protein|uniref:hypothetical protein n=1 Tax=Lactobacillus crispatus TaxID=47770 RepID=UPI000F4F1D4D|nr:hypothetical protein [Lactobacillus crispatus]